MTTFCATQVGNWPINRECLSTRGPRPVPFVPLFVSRPPARYSLRCPSDWQAENGGGGSSPVLVARGLPQHVIREQRLLRIWSWYSLVHKESNPSSVCDRNEFEIRIPKVCVGAPLLRGPTPHSVTYPLTESLPLTPLLRHKQVSVFLILASRSVDFVSLNVFLP